MTQAVLQEPPNNSQSATGICLVRFGSVPEVGKFAVTADSPQRGAAVVVETHRGLQLGEVLERLKPSPASNPADVDFRIVRLATPEDLETASRLTQMCDDAFPAWCARILQWNLNLELIDIEQTLDEQKQILYVLCERGPDSTKLALQAAAAGLGLIEVQPVSASGPVQMDGGSCGTGGGGCGCSH
jgi:cell fate regulator YaaT (PSP1 superfamily)